MGPAFAVFYTLFGFPFGRLADSANRTRVIAFGLGVWSLMTVGCGVARQFWQMAAMRVGVGIGEASLSPSAYSIISDVFAPGKLARAISVYASGIYLGSGLAFMLGGRAVASLRTTEAWQLPLVGAVEGWQKVFFYVGLPGLVVVPLLLLTLSEPVRRGLVGTGKVRGRARRPSRSRSRTPSTSRAGTGGRSRRIISASRCSLSRATARAPGCPRCSSASTVGTSRASDSSTGSSSSSARRRGRDRRRRARRCARAPRLSRLEGARRLARGNGLAAVRDRVSTGRERRRRDGPRRAGGVPCRRCPSASRRRRSRRSRPTTCAARSRRSISS